MKLTFFITAKLTGKLATMLAVTQICFCVAGQAIERRDIEGALARVQRVYVEQLGGADASDQMRDILIAALQNSGLFLLTENPERADATIRGSAGDVTFTDEHHTSDTLGAHLQSGVTPTGKSTKVYSGAGLTDNESTSSKERKHEASASIRMVAGNGDVIWSTTQESGGGRFRGAMADVAEKIVRKLTDDMEKARKQAAASPEKPIAQLKR